MATATWKRVHTQPIVLDIGQNIGALIVHVAPELHGREIEVSPKSNAARRTHTDVVERIVAGRSLWVAVFPALPEGGYSLWRDVMTDHDVTIVGGAIAEVDWRDVTHADDFREALPEGCCSPGVKAPAPAWFDILPAKYHRGAEVSSAPMESARLSFSSDGEVAWDQMWGGFCELALAGGPKHRDTVLEPATREEAAAEPDEYARVVAELERGLRLVTARPTAPGHEPGWVGVHCDGEPMAQWLLRAIAEENVSVRREGAVLFLPAAPTFRLDKEIKNVVTAVAKTVHYWLDHRGALSPDSVDR